MHNVPGKKTDVLDAEWGAELIEHGLLRPSFVPPKPIRELRDLTRYRKSVIEERGRETQRLHKVLEDAGFSELEESRTFRSVGRAVGGR
jgi:transposase